MRYTGPPMTLGNMRNNGVRQWVSLDQVLIFSLAVGLGWPHNGAMGSGFIFRVALVCIVIVLMVTPLLIRPAPKSND
jgi:hypothetical protein